jgi:hypothetical protein
VKRSRRASGLLAALAIIIAYFLLFPHPLGRELVARPSWMLALPGADSLPVGGVSPSQPGSEKLIPFQAGSLFGYVTTAGRLVHAEKTPFGVALTDAGYVAYSRLGRDWVLRDPSGERRFSFTGRGYPLLGRSPAGPRVLVAKTDLTGLQEVDAGGEPLWSRDFPSMITSISVAADGLVAGLLNGSLEFVNRAGATVFSAAPAGSRVPVIMAAAAAADGSWLACVAGIDPQFLVLYGRKGSTFGETSRAALPAGFRREIRMGFSPDSRWLVVEGEGAVGIVDPVSGRLAWTPLPGTLEGIAFPGTPRAAALLSRAGTAWNIALVEPTSAVHLRAAFRAERASVSGAGSAVLLAADGRLLCLELGEM